MRYWLCALSGIVLLAAAIALTASGLYFMLLVGSCASGGPYEIARPCPEGTGLRVGMLVGGVFLGLLALGVWAARRFEGEGARLGPAAWALGFGALAAAFAYAGFGPDATDDTAGWKLFSALMAGFFTLFVVVPMLFRRGAGRRREQAERLIANQLRAPAVMTDGDAAPAGTGVVATGPAPDADSITEDLRKLGELRAQGVLSDEEFERAKGRLLGST